MCFSILRNEGFSFKNVDRYINVIFHDSAEFHGFT